MDHPDPLPLSPLAAEVRRRMLALGVTQKALALQAGLNETYVRDLLRGRSRSPQVRELSKLAAALGCELADLTDPGRPGSLPRGEEVAQDAEEVLLLRTWRSLTPAGKIRFALGAQMAAPTRNERKDIAG